jgi:hypothetical protein
MLSHERSLGGQLTTNTLMFTPPNQFDKPEFARKPLIRWGQHRLCIQHVLPFSGRARALHGDLSSEA